jgi:hypothetical protein
MPNRRVLLVQGVVTNGVALGGTSELSFTRQHRSIRSEADGTKGSQNVDRFGLRVGVSLTISDVTKAATVLNATPGDTTFYAQESGLATYHKYELLGASAGKIVWNGMRLRLDDGGYGSLTLNGLMAFFDGTKDLKDAFKMTPAQTAPTLTNPGRLFRPHTASFDPDGADPAIAPLHVKSMELSLDADTAEDSGDADIGVTAVDIIKLNPLQVTIVHRDAARQAANLFDITDEVMSKLRGVLTATLLGAGGQASKVLTVNNLLWTGADPRHRADYTEWTMRGEASWRKEGGTPVDYTLTGGTALFTIA